MAVLGRFRLPLALAFVALALSPALAVFGGKDASADPVARYVAAILYRTDDGAHLCTAVALTPRLLLTAAHCTEGRRSDLKVIFAADLTDIGEDRLRAVAEVVKAGRTAASKGKSPYQDPDDLALVLLDAPAPAGTRFLEVSGAADGASLTIAGYGATSHLRRPNADSLRQLGFDRRLRTATVPILSIDPALLIGDQTSGAGACTGDSGSPALANGALVGILIGVSSPRDTNDYCRGKAYFATLARWQSWIETTATRLGQPLR